MKCNAYPSTATQTEGERVSNITEWGLRQFRERYEDESITPEDIFAYTYASLHDPAYRQKYEQDLRREFPRLPFHEDFSAWARLGQELLDLHIGFESAEPYGLVPVNKDIAAGKATLKADKGKGAIILDSKTTLTGVPDIGVGIPAWAAGRRWSGSWTSTRRRGPGTRPSAEKFNTYRFADHKERVVDLLQARLHRQRRDGAHRGRAGPDHRHRPGRGAVAGGDTLTPCYRPDGLQPSPGGIGDLSPPYLVT